jgi:Na+-transporting NADH:ubiquinone oxidoreductase subunit A
MPAPHRVTRGLDLPIAGAPAQVISASRPVSQVAVLPSDHIGTKPRLRVQVGDAVTIGQPLWQDRTHEAITVVSPATGVVSAIHRGDRRVIQSVVVTLDGSADERTAPPFASFTPRVASDRAALRALLLESGLWIAFRTRPFSQVPAPDAEPHALFVTAMDTNPLAPSVDAIIAERRADFERGLDALRTFTDATLFVCRAAGSTAGDGVKGVQVADFTGKHPAGTVGYHMHVLAPVSRTRVAWHLGAQDVIRIGYLVQHGRLDPTQVVALGGPPFREPRLVRTRLGASIAELTRDELLPTPADQLAPRVISGSVLTGRQATDPVFAFLGRFHQQVSGVPEVRKREFLGWLGLRAPRFSATPVYAGGGASAGFDTRLHGGPRAMVPIGAYERVLPMDLMATHLLRAIALGDMEWAEELGVLELDEEDVALCSYVCPGKADYGSALRRLLDSIAAEA